MLSICIAGVPGHRVAQRGRSLATALDAEPIKEAARVEPDVVTASPRRLWNHETEHEWDHADENLVEEHIVPDGEERVV
jgi:hypothetical protein